MPRTFSFKDAKELITYYKKLLSNLKKSKNFYLSCQKDLNQQIDILKSDDYFSNIVKNGLKGKEASLEDNQTKSLLTYVYYCIKSNSYQNTCSILESSNSEMIEKLSSVVRAGSNPLLWFFTSKKKKELVEENYKELLSLKFKPFTISANKVLSEIDNLKNTNFKDIKEAYLNEKESFCDAITKANKEVIETDDLLPIFKKNYEKFNNINSKLQIITESLNSSSEDIKNFISRLIAEELVNALRGIPVEELAREKSGLKVKCLHDGGYDNLADIFGASQMQIASIYGISEDAAYTIKSICNNYAKKINKDIKIKLSLDNKSAAASNVVQAIYKYIKKKEQLNKLNELNNEYGNKIQKAFQKLKSIGDGVSWLFLSDEDISNARLSQKYIESNLSTIYITTAKDILKQFDDIKDIDSQSAWNHFAENSIQYFNVIEEVCPGVLGNNDSIYGLPEELARQIQDECFFPDGLLCTLRKYQEWGVKYILHQERVLLGDEMGLGKTIQSIAAMVSLKNTGATHFIVVCPASVVTNWCREVVKHSKLRVTKIHGSGKQSAIKSWIKTGGVAIVNYESTSCIKLDSDFRFSLLVVDEAHYIKNPGARRSINTKELTNHTDRLLFMTGTALENNVDEMINLINILRPDIANDVESYAFMASAPQFREKIAPVYYRRKREDVLTELPEKIEIKELCTLNIDEERIYEDAVLEKRYPDARRVSWNIDDLSKSAKANRLKEIVDEAESEGRKVLVFSFFLDTLRKIHEFLKGRCLNPINGSVNVNRRQEIIDEFDRAPAGIVLLAQINSGGTGLNIQSASVVIICEPQFKPSIENQAISRAYRMGQSRNVLVYRLLAVDTIDEKLMEVLEEKQEIFNTFADTSVAAQSFEIDEKTIGNIINEEIERINKKRNINNSTPIISTSSNDDTIELIDIEYTQTSNLPLGKDYYETIMKMNYDELVQFLINKYGPSKYDYFTSEYCTNKNNNVTRTNEGLLCHHIDEDKAIQLSNKEYAINNPFSYQKANRLVYCNFLEHFLLHILIVEKTINISSNLEDIKGIGGALTICQQLNDFYSGYPYKQSWLIKTTNLVKNDYESYIFMLNRLWKNIKDNYNLSIIFSKQDLAKGWYDTIYQDILNKIK